MVLGGEELAELHRRTEGWATGLYLAALYLREGGSLPGMAGSFGGDDRFVTDYVESEFLARISRRQRVFLTRAAVLERMSGPLCEAVLDLAGAGAVLAELASSNLLLVPLDRRGQWYRYHHLFRDMLRAELERTEPGVVPELQRRAAAWCQRHDLPEEALEYSMAARDVEKAGRLIDDLRRSPTGKPGSRPFSGGSGGWRTRAGWRGTRSPPSGPRLSPRCRDEQAEAERLADAVDRWLYQDPSRPADPAAEAWATMLRYTLCRHGIEQLRADADEAPRKFAAAGLLTPSVPTAQGLARMLSGDLDGGDACFEEAARMEDRGPPDVVVRALCQRALIAMERHQWSQAEDFASHGRSVLHRAGLEKYSLLCAVQGRLALHRGDIPAARRELASAQELRPLLTYAIPHVACRSGSSSSAFTSACPT